MFLDHPALTIYAVSEDVPSVNVWGAERKSHLFEETFGYELRFQWRPSGAEQAEAIESPPTTHAETN